IEQSPYQRGLSVVHMPYKNYIHIHIRDTYGFPNKGKLRFPFINPFLFKTIFLDKPSFFRKKVLVKNFLKKKVFFS
ncbi:MAG: hypothetical protein ACXQTS_05820, partial [Candidatus Methanospirareceae archaeon]